jgi:protein tyrosine phosphatase (PTP) superfamily phosphohydrolase (DUF442 family)
MRIVPTIATLASVTVLGSTARAQHFLRQGPVQPLGQPVLLDTTGLFLARFARAGEDVYVAGQPTERALRQLKSEGVTTVVNLRTPEEMRRVGFDEAALVKQLGMRYVFLPVRGTADYPYSAATLDSFADAMRSTTGKLLLHCTVAWRASHLWGAYLIRERGVTVTEALDYARRINLMDEMHAGGDRQPIEDFLDRRLAELRRSAPN